MTAVNEAQIARWQESGREWVAYEDAFEGQLAPITPLLLDAAALGHGDAVLDVGCGFGTTLLAAAAAVGPSGRVVGVDVSQPMLARAGQRAAEAGAANVELVEGDAQVHPLGGEFDAVISRFGVMFFDDSRAAFANLRAALRPGGRVACAVWQGLDRNPWARVPLDALATVVDVPPVDPTAPGMFALADPGRTTEILAAGGLRSITMTRHSVPTVLAGGGGAGEVTRFLRRNTLFRTALDGVDPDREAAALAAVQQALASYETGDGVVLDAGVWVVTARA